MQHLGTAVLLEQAVVPGEGEDLAHPPSAEGGLRRKTANDVIDTKPIPGARNGIVKLLLRHTKM